MTKSLFVVEIVNTNGSTAYARRGNVEVTADPSKYDGCGYVTYSEATQRFNEGLASRRHESLEDYESHSAQLRENEEIQRLFDREWALGASVALFDKLTANEVGEACRWNNQQYRVKSARGRNRRDGVEIPPGEGRWKSCQED